MAKEEKRETYIPICNHKIKIVFDKDGLVVGVCEECHKIFRLDVYSLEEDYYGV